MHLIECMNWQGDIMNIFVDVLIVGTGVSGLYSALNLNSDLSIILVSKNSISETNTFLAQGGISTARNIRDIPLFVEDTLKAGQYLNDNAAVKVLAEESISNINQILELGMPLDKEDTELSYTKEGAHSINRIVHAKDRTGKELAESLIKEVKKRSNISIYENSYLVDILKENNICCGGIIIKDNMQYNIYAKMVILATGGIGGLFKNSTNRLSITADGLAIALKNHIKLKNLEYIQFHPTAFYSKDTTKRRFLISESLRGEGGKLINCNGERFTDELMPRDIVTKAINDELKKTGTTHVYLDISFLPADYIVNRFPTIYNECIKAGIDITKSPIPVSPTQHYSMGGIQVDLYSKTNMENLYAVGEVSCTGVHGANRLASNSLLEGLVFSRRAAESINKVIYKISRRHPAFPQLDKSLTELQKENTDIILAEFKRRLVNLNDELVNN